MTLLRTRLYEEHIKQNAKMVDFAGWEMPIQYSNLKQEALAVREKVGVFDVSHMGEFFVEGPDAEKFLDNLLPNKVQGLSDYKALYSPLCNEEGKMLDDLIIYKFNSSKFMICVNASNIDNDFNWLSKQVNDYDCKLTNQSQQFSLLALQGPKAEDTLLKLNIGEQIKDLQYYCFQEANDLLIARTGYTGEDGFEIFGPHQKIIELWQQFMELEVEPCGLGARDILRLEVCFPLYGQELTKELTPLDCGLKWTVKLDKENFVGKTALENYQPKYQLIKLTVDKGIPRIGYEIIQNEESIGKVTSGTMSVVLNQGIALGLIDKNKYCPKEKIYVKIRNRLFEANRQTKAFVQGGHK